MDRIGRTLCSLLFATIAGTAAAQPQTVPSKDAADTTRAAN
jgi:hypothetical protein